MSSRAYNLCKTPEAIRAKMLVIGELQGPLAINISLKHVPKHHIVSVSYVFLIGVIDLAGLFVPKQARPVGKLKRLVLSAQSFSNTNCCCQLINVNLHNVCAMDTLNIFCFCFIMLDGPCDSNIQMLEFYCSYIDITNTVNWSDLLAVHFKANCNTYLNKT